MASRRQDFQRCKTCGKNDLMSKRALDQHRDDKEDQFHKGREKYPVPCSSCGRKFMTLSDMTSHTCAQVPVSRVREASNENVGHGYLKQRLDKYFEENVKLNAEEMKQATKVAKEISEHLLVHLETRFEFKKLDLGPIEPVGSSFDGLKVAPPDEFDMIIPINLSSDDWELVDGRTAVVEGKQLDAPGFWLIKRKTKMTTNMDPYLTNKQGTDYVAPGNIIRDLQRKIHMIIRKFKNPEGVVSVKGGLKGPSMYMQVEYTTTHGPKRKFDLDFVLEIRVGDSSDIPKLVAKRHPSITQQGFLGVDPVALLWQGPYS